MPAVWGSDTSEEAAASMTGQRSRIRIAIMAYFVRQGAIGATCDEVELQLGLSHQTASARIREMSLARVIVDSVTERRRTRSGRRARVYKLPRYVAWPHNADATG